MGAITHTPAETALIHALDGAEGWRAAARKAVVENGLPTKRAEAWKWSDLRRAVALPVELARSGRIPDGDKSVGPCEMFRHLGLSGLVLDAGALDYWPGDRDMPAGVELALASDPDGPMDNGDATGVESLAGALAPETLILNFSADQDRAFHVSSYSGSLHQMDAARLGYVIRAGIRASVFESHVRGSGFSNQLIEIIVEPGACFEHVVFVDEDEETPAVRSYRVRLAKGATYRQATLTFGSKLTRHETHITHAGEGAEVHLGGVYLLEEGLHADFTSTVTHTGPGGITRQLVKGAAAAHAQGVFQGKFKVEQAAQQTDAKMTHRALMLDERAEIDAKPELEIYADDVQCAHGNALGAIDETALFYMRQRGLSEVKARAMLIESFLAEPLDMISNEALRESMKDLLRGRLEAIG